MPERTIRILVLDESESDVEDMRSELRSAGVPILMERAGRREDFLEKLTHFKPDLVFSDYSLTEMEGLEAMTLLHEKMPETPFIFVSWTIHEGSVIEALQKGATDYLFKDQLTRLPLSVHRAIREADERRALAEANRVIRLSEEHFRSLIENASDIIMTLDPHGTIYYASPSVRRVLGYEPEDFLGKSILDFIHADDQDHAVDIYQLVPEAADSAVMEFRFLHKNGQWRHIEAFWRVLTDESGNRIAIVNSRDVTDRHEEQEALRESILRHLRTQTELHSTQKKIIEQERLSAIGQMASGIAHDFSNSLMPVLGFAEILLNRPETLDDKEKTKKFLEIINTSARDAMGIVGRLREFYRTKEKAEDVHELDLNALIRQTVLMTQPKWRDEALARGIEIHMNENLGPIECLLGNQAALREVLTNLIFNAVDAMRRSGQISFFTRQDRGQIILEVSDTGEGMDEDVCRRCFEPFFTTKGRAGTGLGLSMVYGVIRRHEGSIEAKSQLGQGTTFMIRLPIRHSKGKSVDIRPRDEAHPAKVPNLRVLVVDDEPSVQEVLREYLSADGHAVSTACDGREGLEAFKKGAYDLVITDRAMPEMNGDLMVEKIREISSTIPIIMVTGFGELMKAKGEHPAGVDVILSKPVTLAVYRDALVRLFVSQT